MRLLACIIYLFVCCAVVGQYKGSKFPIKDEWFWKYGAKSLQEGDKMPDITLGTVINNKTGKKRFSDFKGKLVILDFWGTGCTSCFAKFPEMEQLQKEFGDQIQIFLVNSMETEAEIKERMAFKNIKFPDLPSIISNRSYKNLEEYFNNPPPIGRCFPLVGVPHHVWIDTKGVVRLRGGAENTYAAKIKDFLAGRPITFLKNDATIPNLKNDRNTRYYQQLGYMQNTPVVYGSFITPYTNEVTGSYGAINTVVDSVHKTRTSYYINQDLLTLYNRCLRYDKALKNAGLKQFIFSPGLFDFIEFPPGANILDYAANSLLLQRQLTTEEITRSKYCYEQIVPLTVTGEEREQMMLDDLNRYFKVHLGIIGAVRNRMVKYYELIQISGTDKIGTTNFSQFSAQIIDTDGKAVLDFRGYLGELFNALFKNKNSPIAQGLLHDPDGKPFIVLNGTGWDETKKVALTLAVDGLQSIADLRKLLQIYGLDLVEKEGELPLCVFTRVEEQTK